MAAPYVSPPTAGLPAVPAWVPPPPTEMDLDWASLHTIDLSLLDSPDPQVVADLVARTKTAIKEDGFLYLTNYGISLEQLHRQFSLAQYLHRNISDADKARLLWDPATGLFAGFKRRLGWKREAQEFDGIEQFNFYAGEFADPANKVPDCIQPFWEEITSFCHYLTNSVNRRLLVLLSRVLELPDDFLWDHVQAHEGPVGDGYFRHALFYPLPAAERARRQAVRMYGHTDYGTTTFLFSVPITALQIWSARRHKWQHVRYSPGALVINIGDALEIISGGHFQATRHKVADTPADQQHEERLSIVQFNASLGGIRLAPIEASPLIQREGVVTEPGSVFQAYQALLDAGQPVPTNKEWREIQVSTRPQTAPDKDGKYITEIDGVQYATDHFYGVVKMIPV